MLADEAKDSRVARNNWIISNQVLKDCTMKNEKQPSVKSVMVVKPNHALQPSDSTQPHRGSLKKASS